MKQVLLYSGGWDSYCASKILPNAKKLYVNLHTPYSEVEMKRLPKDVEIQDLDLQRYVLADGYHVPQRNAILALIAIASVMKEAEQDNDRDIEIYICGVYEDLNPTTTDKSPEYFELINKLANAFGENSEDENSSWNIKVKGFFEYDKVSLWEKAGKPNMRNIISCYTGDNCGECLDCKRRLLYLNHIYPNEYKIDKQKYINEVVGEGWKLDKKITEQKG